MVNVLKVELDKDRKLGEMWDIIKSVAVLIVIGQTQNFKWERY